MSMDKRENENGGICRENVSKIQKDLHTMTSFQDDKKFEMVKDKL